MRLITVEDEDSGRRLTVASRTGDQPAAAFDAALVAFQRGEQTPGFQVLDVTPQESVGKMAGRKIASFSRNLKRDTLNFLDTELGERIGTQFFGSNTALKAFVKVAPLPESVADVGADIGFTAAGMLPGVGVGVTAARIAIPTILTYLGGLAEDKSKAEAAGQATITGLAGAVPEGGRVLAGVGKRLAGVKQLQKQDLERVTSGFQKLLPEGAPTLPANAASLSKVVDKGKGSLPEFASNLFERRLKDIDRLSADIRINVPSINPEAPITVREAIDAVSKGGFKLRGDKALTGTQQLTSLDRNNLIEEIQLGIAEVAKVNRKAAVIGTIYEQARREFRQSQDVIRLLSGKKVFPTETGRLNMGELQTRVLALRREGRLSPESLSEFENIVSRGTGNFAQVDQPTFELPIGFFTRSGVVPGAGFRPFGGRVAIPRFTGVPQSQFAARGTQGTSPAVGAALSQQLRSSPFGGADVRPTVQEDVQ